MWWEKEERQALSLWIAALSAGSDDIPSPGEVWQVFTTELGKPPVKHNRDELTLRRSLGVA